MCILFACMSVYYVAEVPREESRNVGSLKIGLTVVSHHRVLGNHTTSLFLTTEPPVHLFILYVYGKASTDFQELIVSFDHVGF